VGWFAGRPAGDRVDVVLGVLVGVELADLAADEMVLNMAKEGEA